MSNFFQKKLTEYEKTFLIAKKANEYARSQILKGSTQLENNELNADQQNHLKKAMKGSTVSEWNGNSISDIIADQTEKRMSILWESPILATYNSIITVTSKFSLGNCNELALQALEYVLQKSPEIDAEIYKIEGGDHTFLVLNRDRNPYKSANNPLNWGPNAIICDPWANDVYPAKDCMEKLKSYYWDENDNRHKTQLYDPSKHYLMPSEFFNTTILRAEKNLADSRKNIPDHLLKSRQI